MTFSTNSEPYLPPSGGRPQATPRQSADLMPLAHRSILVPTCPHPVRAAIRPPGSKSITNRALVCAGLARGGSLLTGVLDSQDTRVMAAGLAALGIGLEADWAGSTIRVTGCGGVPPATAAVIDCAASGTTMR